MNVTNVNNILIPEYRIRRVFEQVYIDELAKSISEVGLIQAPVLRSDSDGKVWLVAGERRLRALQTLFANGKGFIYEDAFFDSNANSIPYVRKSELPVADALRIEMEENTIRRDLSWQEVSAARAYIHNLRQKEADVSGKEEVSVKSTVQHITGGSDSPSVRASIALAKYLNDPEVSKAKTMKEAVKIVERKHRNILMEELNTRMGGVKHKHVLVNEDSRTWMLGYESGVFDIIITDPPYGIDMHTMNPQSGSEAGTRHTYDDTKDYAASCIEAVAQIGYRITKPNAHCFMFCDIKMWNQWAPLFSQAGWYVWPVPIIWNKLGTGSLLGAANGPRHCYEAILFAQKGSKKCKVVSDVIDAPAGDASLHPANKSHEILTSLLAMSAVPGDIVLDAFCGSGGIFAAADEFNCVVHACEKDPVHYQTALSQLNKGAIE